MTAAQRELSVYFKTPRFSDVSVPDKLLRNHTLKPGVYGRLVVFEGEVELFVEGDPPTHTRVLPGDDQVQIPPEQPHRILPSDGATFCLELMRETT